MPCRILSFTVLLALVSATSLAGPLLVNQPPRFEPLSGGPSGIVGWWRGEGNANDAVGGNHGTLHNGATFAAGMVGQAFSLDGANDYVGEIGTTSTFAFIQNTGVFTIEAWIKLTDPNAIAEQAITANTPTTIENGHYFTWDNSAGQQRLSLVLMKGVSGTPVISSATIATQVITNSNWHHVAAVGNGTGITFYVDGTAKPGSGTMGSKASGNSTRALDIGHCPPVSSQCPFNGRIDELAIYNRALSASEIQSIYNAGSAGRCALSIGDVTVTEGNAGTVNATFTVSLSSPNAAAVTVDYATANGTATASNDYVAGSGTLTIPAKSLSTTVTVVVNGDVVDENDETFFVNLSNATNATITDAQGKGTITDDDGPLVSINDKTVVEGNSGSVFVTFTVSLSSPSGQTVTVHYLTEDGTASLDDYQPDAGTLTFSPGSTARTVSVEVFGDQDVEDDETFFVTLYGATNATIGDAQGQCTILDDDAVLTVSIGDVTVTEDHASPVNANFIVSLSHVTGQAVTVNYATADGTATAANNDYVPKSGSVMIPANTLFTTVAVVVNADLVDESDETFFVNLSGPVNATIGDGQGQGTVHDNYPSISINNVALAEGNSGSLNATFTVSLSSPSAQTVTVNYTTADGTATVANNDYVPASGVLSIPSKVLSATVTVAVKGDPTAEGSEYFFVNLSGAVNASVADGQGRGTVLNDDFASGTVGLAWNDAPSFGQHDRVFSCNTNLGGTHTLFGTFTPPSTMSFDGMTAEIDVTSEGALPDWWRLGPGECRPSPGASFDFTNGPQHADDPYLGTAQGSVSYTIVSPNRACIRVQCDLPEPVAVGALEYYAFKVILPGSKTVGSGGCSGCSTPVCITLNNVWLHGAEGDRDVGMFGALPYNFATWQGGPPNCPTPPLGTVSVNDVSATEGSSGTSAVEFTIARTNSGCEETRRTVDYTIVPISATPGVDYVAASGTAVFESGVDSASVYVTVNGDATVEPDETFLIRLDNPRGLSIADAEGVGTIVNDDGTTSVPAADLARIGASPNPFRDRVEISFALGSGGLIRLEVYDLGGRRVRSSHGTYFPAGPQTLAWDGRADDGTVQPSGVYTMRVSGQGIEMTRRVVRLN